MDLDCITERQLQILRILVARLNKAGIDYQVSGGLAGNIHGSSWPLQDIDIEVARGHMLAIEQIFAEFVTEPLHYFENDEFRMFMVNLTIEGISVDINQAEGVFVNTNGDWSKLDTDLKMADTISWRGLVVQVQPLHDLIHYKELLGRVVDVNELRLLSKR
jgi:hypothetical protein